MIYLQGEAPQEMFDYVVEFLDIKQAQASRDGHFIQVEVTAACESVAARLGWDELAKKLGRVPFKSDFNQLSVVQRG